MRQGLKQLPMLSSLQELSASRPSIQPVVANGLLCDAGPDWQKLHHVIVHKSMSQHAALTLFLEPLPTKLATPRACL